ncbi:MAG: hypothetical protein M3070_12410 [Actinomycetota bacterium]|nr:hypothetical protein [Actinomycetota bacterium]
MSEPRRDVPSVPLWLLDIDGVVNALAYRPGGDVWPRNQWVRCTITTPVEGRGVMTLPILAARPVLDFVSQVHERGLAEIRWHSTWRDAAMTAFAPKLGLPTSIQISVAPEWTDRPVGLWWKLAAAQRAVEAGRRLVWTDDDLAVFADQAAEVGAHPDTLLIGPDPEHGLSPDDLMRIGEFLGIAR